jgi:N-methylhydantoinase A
LAFSGPAGGVIGSIRLTEAAGYGDLITFDMGGTSTDVAIVAGGRAQLRRSTEVDWGIPYRFPSFDIKSVGAGGGSIAWLDAGGALRMGPRSAGVDPGPACYGRGGTAPTTTDINVVLGLIPDHDFGYSSIEIDADAADRALTELAQTLDLTTRDLARGAWRTINANMAQAIRAITVYRGIDPRDFSLFCFGGAAGQHAAAVAQDMRLKRVIVPAAASVFSAVGMLLAPLHVSGGRSVNCLLEEFTQQDAAQLGDLERQLRSTPAGRQLPDAKWTIECRHVGQTHSLDVDYFPSDDDVKSLEARFLSEHSRLYGIPGDAAIEVVNARLTLASGEEAGLTWPRLAGGANGHSRKDPQYLALEDSQAEVWSRDQLSAGTTGKGPALIVDPSTTVYVPRECRWAMDEFGSILIDIGGMS